MSFLKFFFLIMMCLSPILTVRLHALTAARQEKELILNSIEQSSRISFQAVCGKDKEYAHIKRLAHSDGTVSERRDYFVNDKNILSTISNQQGLFFLRDNILLKNELKNYEDEYPALNWNWAWSAIKRDLQVECKYSVSQTSYQGVPCYLIKVTTPVDDQTMAILSGKTEVEAAAKRDVYAAAFPAVKQIYVNRSNRFMYRCVMFNIQGKQLTEMNWGKVDFNAPNASAFELPKEVDVVLKTEKDIQKFAKKRNAGPSIFTRVFDYIDNHFSSIVLISTYLLLVVAVVCVSIVIVLKLRQRRRS